MKYDVFISHASEDKEHVVRPLAQRLRDAGIEVWLDESELTLGDSLRRSIDDGLSQSRFGLVVLSPSFFSKEWPQKELDYLVAREDGTAKVILPIWHNVDHANVAARAPLLADRLAISTTEGLDRIAEKIAYAVRRIRPSTDDSTHASQSTVTNPDEALRVLMDAINESTSLELYTDAQSQRELTAHADSLGNEMAKPWNIGFALILGVAYVVLPGTIALLLSNTQLATISGPMSLSAWLVPMGVIFTLILFCGDMLSIWLDGFRRNLGMKMLQQVAGDYMVTLTFRKHFSIPVVAIAFNVVLYGLVFGIIGVIIGTLLHLSGAQLSLDSGTWTVSWCVIGGLLFVWWVCGLGIGITRTSWLTRRRHMGEEFRHSFAK